MKIGIDISQLAYKNTGVANYLEGLVSEIIKNKEHEFVLFFSSLRRDLESEIVNKKYPNVTIKRFKFPPVVLDFVWNQLHVMPIENLIGNVDVFITSDWTEPPVKRAKKMTILYDLIVYKYPEETAAKIVAVQKRKLAWVRKETSTVLCISEATKNDCMEILGIEKSNLSVIYPGF